MNRFGGFVPPLLMAEDLERRERMLQLARQQVNYTDAAVNEFARQLCLEMPDDVSNYIMCIQDTEDGKRYWFQRKVEVDLPVDTTETPIKKWTTIVKSGEVLVYKRWSDGSGEQCPLARLNIGRRTVDEVRADAQCMADALNRRDGEQQ